MKSPKTTICIIAATVALAGCSNPLVPDAASESSGQSGAGISAAAPAIGSPRTDIGTMQQNRAEDAQVIQDATTAVQSLTSGGR